MVRNQLFSFSANVRNGKINNYITSRDLVFFLAIGVALISCLITFIGDTSPQIVLGTGFTLSVLLLIYSHYLTSYPDPFFSIAFAMATLIFGVALTVVNPDPLILGIGAVLTSLSFIYYRYRISENKSVAYRVIAIVLGTGGFVLAFQSFDSVSFTIGFAFLSLYLLFDGFFRPMHRSFYLN